MTEKIISVPDIDPQEAQLLSFIRAVLNEATLDKTEKQRLIESGDMLQGKVRKFISDYRPPYFQIADESFPVQVDYTRTWKDLRKQYGRYWDYDDHWDSSFWYHIRSAPVSGVINVNCKTTCVSARLRTFKQLEHMLRGVGYKLADVWTLISFGEQYFETVLQDLMFLSGGLVKRDRRDGQPGKEMGIPCIEYNHTPKHIPKVGPATFHPPELIVGEYPDQLDKPGSVSDLDDWGDLLLVPVSFPFKVE